MDESSVFTFFTPEEEGILLEFVQKFPFIFQLNDEKYKDSRAKVDAWREIADGMGKGEDACKTKWRNMRDWYTRKKRDNKLPTGSGSTAVHLRSRYQRMSFLDGTIVNRSTLESDADSLKLDEDSCSPDNDIEQSIGSQNSDTVLQSSSLHDAAPQSSSRNSPGISIGRRKSPGKQKIKSVRQQMFQRGAKMSRGRMETRRDIVAPSAKSKDEFDHFFESMALSTRVLPRHIQIKVKQQISNVIFAAENEALLSSEGSTNRLSPSNFSTYDCIESPSNARVPPTTSLRTRRNTRINKRPRASK